MQSLNLEKPPTNINLYAFSYFNSAGDDSVLVKIRIHCCISASLPQACPCTSGFSVTVGGMFTYPARSVAHGQTFWKCFSGGSLKKWSGEGGTKKHSCKENQKKNRFVQRKIPIIQNKCIKRIFFAHRRENAIPYFNLMGILSFDNIFKLKIATFTYKIINDSEKMPVIFENMENMVSFALTQHQVCC